MRRPTGPCVVATLLLAGCRARLPLPERPDRAAAAPRVPATPVPPTTAPAGAPEAPSAGPASVTVEYYQISDG